MTVDLGQDEALRAVGDDALAVAHVEAGRVVRLDVGPRTAPSAPPMWFAEIDEPDGRPPALSLVAFTGHDVEPGLLLDRAAVRETGVRSSEQLGALRWYPATGEVDQVYVAPAWRRQGVGTVLVTVSAVLNAARGLPRFWGDGQRTADGDRWRAASTWSHRAAPLTHLAPPMTPYDER